MSCDAYLLLALEIDANMSWNKTLDLSSFCRQTDFPNDWLNKQPIVPVIAFFGWENHSLLSWQSSMSAICIWNCQSHACAHISQGILSSQCLMSSGHGAQQWSEACKSQHVLRLFTAKFEPSLEHNQNSILVSDDSCVSHPGCQLQMDTAHKHPSTLVEQPLLVPRVPWKHRPEPVTLPQGPRSWGQILAILCSLPRRTFH